MSIFRRSNSLSTSPSASCSRASAKKEVRRALPGAQSSATSTTSSSWPHDVDLWVLLIFGLLGYAMRRYGFPLAPMILGVVLGDNAEINLIRALATDDNLMIFFMRPWSLFFLMIATASVIFPWFQKYRGKKKWTLLFSPILAIVLSIPMFMMGGQVRPVIAVALVAIGLYIIYKRHRGGWELKPVGADEHQLRES